MTNMNFSLSSALQQDLNTAIANQGTPYIFALEY